MDYAQSLLIYGGMLFGIMIIPGVDMAFVIGNALARGARGAIAALVGLMLGGGLHAVMWTSGLGVLLTQAPLALDAITLAGSAYLVWIGWSLIAAGRRPPEDGADPVPTALVPDLSARSIVLRGIGTCLLNPKAHLFMAAVFPQFLRPDFGPLWQQGLMLGVMGMLVQAVVYGAAAAIALGGRNALETCKDLLSFILIVVGAGFVVIGLAGIVALVLRLA